MLVDGTGGDMRAADLLLQNGTIAWIGTADRAELDARDTLDATGLFVAPGFIDGHAHGNPLGESGFGNFLAMGVTTIVLGQDGSSPSAGDLAAHLDAVDEARPAVNVAYLAGHNTLRMESAVGYGVADDEALEALADLVGSAMDAGAFGLSTGLEYDPGIRADAEELAAAARPVAERGGVVMSHMRNEDAHAVEASLAELVEQGRRSGARVHASHMKVVLGSDPGQAERMLETMARARAEGVRVTGDVYPYTASFTGLSILFPEWARPPHDYGAVASSRREELLDHLRARVESRNGPDATLFGSGPYAGRTLADAARDEMRPYEEILLELGPGGASAAYFVMDEDVMAAFLADPFVAVASDGSSSMAHPRGYGTFPLVLQRWVRDEALLALEEAVRKMTELPAAILGLDDAAHVRDGDLSVPPRGRLAPGWAADLTLFDLDELEVMADFQAPHRLARGVRYVFVAGEPVWERDGPLDVPGRGVALRFVPTP
jgi:N-acyl-D-amino-acid deacylase